MAKRRSSRSKSRGLGWLWLLLVVVLTAGAGWYYLVGPGRASKPAVAEQPAPKKKKAAPEEPTEDPDRFEFYNMLPSGEVEVPEDNGDKVAGPGSAPVSRPGTYVLQAGAFPAFATADAVKARLALIGITAEIQPVEVNGTTFHRVRIGPIDSLPQLNSVRARLHAQRIDHQLIPGNE
jgi:cell division protein FtsN